MTKSPDKNTTAKIIFVTNSLRIFLSYCIANTLIRTGGTTRERRISAMA